MNNNNKTYEDGVNEALSYVNKTIRNAKNGAYTTPIEALTSVKTFLENRFKRFI